MNKFLAIALAAATLAAGTAAEARDGCGRGFFRGPAGHCRPMGGRGPAFVAPGVVVGGFYPGRGYWDGRRYYANRYHYRGGWRYR